MGGETECSPRTHALYRVHPRVGGEPPDDRRGAPDRPVHPRVGGETVFRPYPTVFGTGPSPRGRGNLLRRAGRRVLQGSIPAWAGKPKSDRGYSDSNGSIPAWAGKPLSCGPRGRAFGVHPRVGGETEHAGLRCRAQPGPSPRGRGNLVMLPIEVLGYRSIPAWAGKPRRVDRGPRGRGVHPRVGGETPSTILRFTSLGGPSPRGRGNLWVGVSHRPSPGSIPAWAGKPGWWGAASGVYAVHPRVGGETHLIAMSASPTMGPSPRGRGNLALHRRPERRQGSIPAWAGNRSVSKTPADCPGSIPAWAGKPIRLKDSSRLSRVHPAWAGKPC